MGSPAPPGTLPRKASAPFPRALCGLGTASVQGLLVMPTPRAVPEGSEGQAQHPLLGKTPEGESARDGGFGIRRGRGCFVGTGSPSHFPGHPDNKHQRPRREKPACLLHMKSHFVPLTMPGLFGATSSCQREGVGGNDCFRPMDCPRLQRESSACPAAPQQEGSHPAFELAPACLVYVPHFAPLCPPARPGGGGLLQRTRMASGALLGIQPPSHASGRPPFAQSALAQRLYGGVICSGQAE